MIDPAIGTLLAAAFALLFGSAALHKLLDPGSALPRCCAPTAWCRRR